MNHRLPNHKQDEVLAACMRGEISNIAKKYTPEGKVGDKIRFYNGARCVAVAKIARIEEPTPINDRWLVFWEPESFQLTK